MKKLYKYIITAFLLFAVFAAHAQLNLAASSYYQNQYLNNPSYAGLDKGLILNGGMNQLLANVPGSLTQQFFTANYGIADKRIGLGLSLRNEKVGLIRKTNMLVSYAYHIPLNNANDQLNFGVSLGVQSRNIDLSSVIADGGDMQTAIFNDKKNYLDGDVGVSYTTDNLNIQASIPNLKSMLDSQYGVDKNVFIAAISYKWALGYTGYWSVEPKVIFRGIKGYTNIVDLGTQINLPNEILQMMYMYHSSGNNTLGVSVNASSTLQVMAMYTTNTAALSEYINAGRFELGLKLVIF